MKNLSSLLIITTVLFAFSACKVNEQHAVNKVAKEFITSLNAKKYAKAKKLATPESVANIDMLQSMSSLTNEQKPTPIIENIVCIIDGEKAKCNYQENGEQKNLELVKIRGKWYVEMKKETPADMNTNSDSNRQRMIEDSIRAADQYINNYQNQINDYNNQNDQGYDYVNNDTVTYFDLGILSMHESNGSVYIKFNITNRSEWNIQHFWLETYISSKTGNFIQKNDLMFDGIIKSKLFNDISNVDEILERGRIEVVLRNTLLDDIGEVFLLPIRFQMEPGSNENIPFDMSIHNIARYVKLRNDSSYKVNITF